jgi:hypothetical protein
MKLLYILALISPLGCIAQDYIKLDNGDALNGKIVSVADSQLVFQRQGITKQIHLNRVTQLMYNSSVFHEHQTAVQDASLTYQFSKPHTSPPPVDYLGNAKGFQVMGIGFLVLAAGSATYSLWLKQPIEPIAYLTPQDYADYKVELEDYRLKRDIANGVAIASASLSIAAIIMANHNLIKLHESKQTALSLRPGGFSLVYTFK